MTFTDREVAEKFQGIVLFRAKDFIKRSQGVITFRAKFLKKDKISRHIRVYSSNGLSYRETGLSDYSNQEEEEYLFYIRDRIFIKREEVEDWDHFDRRIEAEEDEFLFCISDRIIEDPDVKKRFVPKSQLEILVYNV